MKRRELIYTLAGTTLAAGALGTVLADEHVVEGDTNEDGMVDLLYVQYAAAATLEAGVLTLIDVTPDVLFFSDRPDRIWGRETMEDFLASWSLGEHSFEEVPPNAVLAVANPEGGAPLDMVVVLKNPSFKDGNLSYEVGIMEGPEEGKGGACALFIDLVGSPVRRVARRTARRTTRRTYRRQDALDDAL